TALLKLTFHPGTDMAQALAQTIGYVNRARAFMPPGTVGPFVMRFDAGTVPVGYLVFSSGSRSLGEIQDLALNRVRPQFATLDGLTSPPPFGGSQRTIVIRVDPDRLQSYGMAPEEVIRAVSAGNVIMPSGSVNIGDQTRIAPVNSVVSNINDLLELPIRTGAGPTVFVRDVGSVSDSTDIPTAYALVNGRRAVYIPVTKRPAASTLAVVAEVKANLPRFQALVPDDIKVSYELDQSGNVSGALQSVLREAILGALLTGLMVLLFLRDWRSSLVVIVTIPFALLAAVVGLWAAGQTINIMTLGGLALAVGILVDEGTVAIENIHTHLARGAPVARGVLEAGGEVFAPRLLAMLAVVAVFVPSFFMTGVSRSLFVPLSLAVGFAMIASFLLSGSLVPVLAIWLLGQQRASTLHEESAGGWLPRLRGGLTGVLDRIAPARGLVVAAYAVVAIGIVALVGLSLGREIFPSGGANQFQLRFEAPAGTKFEATERLAGEVLGEIGRAAGAGNVAISLGYVGVQPSSYPINTIFLWTGGPQEGVLQVALRPQAGIRVGDLEERLRRRFAERFPGARFSFEPGDIVGRIMNFGAPTPVQVAITGPDFAATRAFARKVREQLSQIGSLRDLRIEQALDYPAVRVNIDRQLAGQLGVTVSQIGQSFAAATSSSRFVAPNYWADPRTGVAFQLQLEVPQSRMRSLDDLRAIPVGTGGAHPLLGDVARVEDASIVGEYDRLNGQRMVTLSANMAGEDLGRVASRVDEAIARAGKPPRGSMIAVRGQIAPMRQTLRNVSAGLAVAVVVIFLLLAANFQSLRLAFVVVSTVPAVLAGVVTALALTGTTLNVQSFMGAIMAIGIAVANAILLVTFAEDARRRTGRALAAGDDAARARMRPVLMTSAAMIAGMIPMALA
ncbi:MAG: efflux RND transporter permease subunit, partial [Bacteroidales bacterium]